MISLKQLLVRLTILVVAFFMLAFFSIILTTLIFQNNIHPDNWTMTIYDISGLAFCSFGFIIFSGIQIKKYLTQLKSDKSEKISLQ